MRRSMVLPAVLGGIFLAGLLSASSARAGRIFGDIRLDGKPVPAGVLVIVTPVAAPPPPPAPGPGGKGKAAAMPAPTDSTQTDKVGSYKVTVKNAGKCNLTLVYENQSVSLEVFSYEEATRYDLILEKKASKFTLRRK